MSQIVDARGLSCPAPILRARAALKNLAAGEQLTVLSSDPGSMADFPAFCRSTGDELIEQAEDGDVYRFVIRRAI